METTLLAGAAACAAGAAAMALGPDPGGCPVSRDSARVAAGRFARAMRRLAKATFASLGKARPVKFVAEQRDWRECSAEAARAFSGLGIELSVPEGTAALMTCAALTGLAGSALFATWLFLPVALVLLAFGIPLWASRRRDAKSREVATAMPAAFRTLSVAMGAGMTLAQASEHAAGHVDGAVGEAFGLLALRLRCGMATEPALGLLERELDAPGAELLAAALAISHRTGSPLKDLLLRSARLVERQGEFRRLLAVKTAQVRLSVRVVCLLPAVTVMFLATISPDFQKGLASPAGIACVLLAAALDATAVAIIRRIMGKVL